MTSASKCTLSALRTTALEPAKPASMRLATSCGLMLILLEKPQAYAEEPRYLHPLYDSLMQPELSVAELVDLGRQALSIEIDGLRAQLPRLGPDFARACRICLNCRGRVVVTGMGKSGHIGGKIAATLASTGTPSFFVHPGEASHGDG